MRSHRPRSLGSSRTLGALALISFCCALSVLIALTYWPDQAPARAFAAGATVLAYLFFCGIFFLRHKKNSPAAAPEILPADSAAADGICIAYASQTGYAEQLAQQTALSLQEAGMQVQLLPLAQLSRALLQQAKKILFIVSTSGEGDAPDNAAGFVRACMSRPLALTGLQYGILALGDLHYQHYCAFGHRLQHWLHQQQAGQLFDLIEVDNGDQGALRHWQTHLGVLSGHTAMADWSRPAYASWTLTERRLLNPGSAGGPAYHLALQAKQNVNDADMHWQAGDIAEIGPANNPLEVQAVLARLQLSGSGEIRAGQGIVSLRAHLATCLLPQDDAAFAGLAGLPAQALADALPALPHREYSIASIPADGRLELLVRQVRQASGKPGLGSGWLTQYAAPGDEIALRIRQNRSFHAPGDDRPLILIGNGTGIAGLRAHLRQRQQQGRQRNWLLFGERSAQHDYFYQEEIAAWLAQGVLHQADLVFSRDQAQRLYVQDQLAAQANGIREWVGNGAAIYVCGSLEGMAAAVSVCLTAILGAGQLDAMTDEGRYRRDVY